MSRDRKQPYVMSRRLRAFILSAGVVAMVLLVWLDRSVITPARLAQTSSRQADPAQDLARYHGKTFIAIRVVDGDTLDIDAPDGDSPTTRVRLLGIDAPETADATQGLMHYAREATQFARQLAHGQAVTIYLDETGPSRGVYGRLLAYVELPDGMFLNDTLLLEGYAYADLRFQHGRYQKYQQLEGAARSLRKGLWADVSREQLPAWLQRMRPNLLSRS